MLELVMRSLDEAKQVRSLSLTALVHKKKERSGAGQHCLAKIV